MSQMNANMFQNFEALKSCVYKHSSKIITTDFPREALNLVVEQFRQGKFNKSKRLAEFVNILRRSDCCYEEIFDVESSDAPFAGGYGAVFIEDDARKIDLKNGTVARKFFMDGDKELNVVGKEKPIFDALLNLMNYVLFKAILLEAEEQKIIPAGISGYVLEIDEFFIAENSISEDEALQIGFTSRYIRTDWKKADDKMKKMTVSHINHFLRAIESLRKYGVYLTHGDLKMYNIVYEKTESRPYVIDFGISTIRVDYHEGGHNSVITDFVNTFKADGTELGATDIAMFAFCYNRTFNNPTTTAEFANLYRGIFNDDMYNHIIHTFEIAGKRNGRRHFSDVVNSLMYQFIYGSLAEYYKTNYFDYKKFASGVFTAL